MYWQKESASLSDVGAKKRVLEPVTQLPGQLLLVGLPDSDGDSEL